MTACTFTGMLATLRGGVQIILSHVLLVGEHAGCHDPGTFVLPNMHERPLTGKVPDPSGEKSLPVIVIALLSTTPAGPRIGAMPEGSACGRYEKVGAPGRKSRIFIVTRSWTLQ